MKMLLVSLLSLVSVSVLADSQYLDSERLRNCGGEVELRRADNGDLALKFERVDKSYCTQLKFVDVSSRRTIKSYDLQGSSYTLSQKQRDSLGQDCAVEFQLLDRGGRVVERKQVTLGWWCAVTKVPVQKQNNAYSYDISNKGNCKLNIYGEYKKLVDDHFCSPLRGDKQDVVRYEWSNANNCKVMINGHYANKNVSDYYCEVRH